MMIFCQDKEKIEQIGRRVYILKIADTYQVLSKRNDSDVTVLGEYKNHRDAGEVLKTIFQYIRAKKESYCMPDKDNVI